MLSTRSLQFCIFTFISRIMCSFFEACKVIHFLQVDAQLFQHYLLKRLSLFHCIVFSHCQRLVGCIYRGLFLDSLFSSIDVVVYSFTSTILSLFIASLEVKEQQSNIFFSFTLFHFIFMFAQGLFIEEELTAKT